MKEDSYNENEIKEFILEGYRRFQWSKHEQLSGINYKSDCCSALSALPPENPDEYSRVYYYTKLEHGINNIINKKIKLSVFNRVNDLFEIYSFIEVDKEKRKGNDNFREDAQKKSENLCFLSVTLDWNSPVMWSHYANDHYGVCLGLDIKKSLLQQIRYISNRGLIEEVINKKPDESSKTDLIFKVKNESWSYENESRAIFYKEDKEVEEINGNFFLKATNGSFIFKEIIFGSKIDNNTIETEIKKLCCNRENLTLIQARKSDHEYKMVPKSIDKNEYEPYSFNNEKSQQSFVNKINKSGFK